MVRCVATRRVIHDANKHEKSSEIQSAINTIKALKDELGV